HIKRYEHYHAVSTARICTDSRVGSSTTIGTWLTLIIRLSVVHMPHNARCTAIVCMTGDRWLKDILLQNKERIGSHTSPRTKGVKVTELSTNSHQLCHYPVVVTRNICSTQISSWKRFQMQLLE
ncbi:hypothetical protein D918_02799, partial [Trichuris suis]